ncbi:unnamed protein product, partial [Brenthis ino]
MNIPFANRTSENSEIRRLTLNSADLHSLHAAAKEISMEAPLTLDNGDIHSVYYTITPLYLLLLGASALGIGFALRKYVRQRSSETTAECANGEIEQGNTNITLTGLSALFSNQSTNSR